MSLRALMILSSIGKIRKLNYKKKRYDRNNFSYNEKRK